MNDNNFTVDIARDYAQIALNHFDKGEFVAGKLVLWKIIKGEFLNTVKPLKK